MTLVNNTILRLAGVGVPPYSARGLTQTLQPIDAATSQRRTVNGALRDVSSSQFHKYASTISGADVAPPAIDGQWPGVTISVDCIPELAVLDPSPTTESTTEEEALFDKPHVPGSIRRADGFLFYRPRLTFMVRGFNLSAEEWTVGVTWTLDLEEV